MNAHRLPWPLAFPAPSPEISIADVGERGVIVPLDRLTLQDDDLVLDMTREEIEALPTWED